MSFVNNTIPNLEDYITFVLHQGVPIADLPIVQTTLTTTSGSDIATIGSTVGVSAGMIVLSKYLPPQTTIISISGTTVTLSGLATGSGSTQLAYASTDFQALDWTFNIAVDRVRDASCVGGILYVLAVYNLGMHNLIKISLDLPGYSFFQDAREQFDILGFKGGVLASSADQSSSNAIAVPELLKNLSLSDLDLLKTSWGRSYAEYGMNFGPYEVGIS